MKLNTEEHLVSGIIPSTSVSVCQSAYRLRKLDLVRKNCFRLNCLEEGRSDSICSNALLSPFTLYIQDFEQPFGLLTCLWQITAGKDVWIQDLLTKSQNKKKGVLAETGQKTIGIYGPISPMRLGFIATFTLWKACSLMYTGEAESSILYMFQQLLPSSKGYYHLHYLQAGHLFFENVIFVHPLNTNISDNHRGWSFYKTGYIRKSTLKMTHNGTRMWMEQ